MDYIEPLWPEAVEYCMKSILFSLWVMVLAMPVHAISVTGFSNEVNYDAFVGTNKVFLDFDGLVMPGSTGVFTGVDFNTIGATNPDLVNLNNYVGDAGSPSTPNGVGQIQGVLDTPEFAIGMNILSAEDSGTLAVFDENGVWLASAGFSGNRFVGILTDTAFSSFIIETQISLILGNDRIFVDDFRINNLKSVAPVPLPAAWLLFLGGLGLFASARSKLRNA